MSWLLCCKSRYTYINRHICHDCCVAKVGTALLLPLNFLVTAVNSLNTKTYSSKEMTKFSFENADVKSICYCKQGMKSNQSLSSECVETELCKPCTSFTSHLHSSCGMVWYRMLTVKVAVVVVVVAVMVVAVDSDTAYLQARPAWC